MIFTFYCILWHHSSLLSRNSEENDLPLLEETQQNADKGDLLQNLQQSATNANVNNPDFIFCLSSLLQIPYSYTMQMFTFRFFLCINSTS